MWHPHPSPMFTRPPFLPIHLQKPALQWCAASALPRPVMPSEELGRHKKQGVCRLFPGASLSTIKMNLFRELEKSEKKSGGPFGTTLLGYEFWAPKLSLFRDKKLFCGALRPGWASAQRHSLTLPLVRLPRHSCRRRGGGANYTLEKQQERETGEGMCCFP